MYKKYQGVALNPSLNDRGRASGEISFSVSQLLFENTEIKKSLPLSGMKIEMVKAGVMLFYFSHTSEPDWTFYTADKSVLSEKAIENNKYGNNIKSNLAKKKILNYVILTIILVLMGSAFFSAGKLKDLITEYAVQKVPAEWEIKLGEVAFRQFRDTVTFVNSKTADEMMIQLTDPLITKIQDKRYPFKFHIAQNPNINAFALPGGNVVINSGLISFAKTPEEVVGILAHEIAHVQKRHSLTQMINALGMYVGVQLFFGDVTGVMAVFINNASFLVNQSYSRDIEREADLESVQYLVQAGISPDGLLTFFQKVEKKEFVEDRSSSGHGSETTASGIDTAIEKVEKFQRSLYFLSTHPETQERINNIKLEIEKLPDAQRSKKMNFDLDRFKKEIGVEDTSNKN